MDLDQIATPSPDVISQEVAGETVLLDLKSENYFGLNEVGTRVWQMICSGTDLRSIHDALLADYEVEAPQLRADLEELLREVSDLGLITLGKTAAAD